MLLIVTDDQRHDGLEVMPATMKRIAGRGTQYPNAYATTPLCCPSRASILSGQYVHNHGQWDTRPPHELDARTTWPVALDRAGYRTAMLGKYLNFWRPWDQPAGFDVFADVPRDDEHADRWLGDRADRFLARAQEPWALYLAPRSPHSPYSIPERNQVDVGAYPENPAQSETDFSDKPTLAAYPGRGDREESPQELWTLQRQELLGVDEMVGRVMGAMTREQRENTLVMFTSDNGYLVGEHGLETKRWPYLDSVRVPMLARGPGIPESAVDEDLVANVDIASTIYGATGVEPLVEQDGVPLNAEGHRNWLFLEGDDRLAWTSYLSENRHYIRWPSGAVEDYDLVADPWELEAGNEADPTIEAEIDAAMHCADSSCP